MAGEGTFGHGEKRTYGWALARLREVLSDQAPQHYRWRDEELLRFLSQAVEALASVRPASRYLGLRLVRREVPDIPLSASAEALAAFAAEPLLVDPRWHSALVEFAAHRALAMDEADAGNLALSQQHFRAFQEIASR